MIEISIADMFLIAWALVATVYAFKYKHDSDKTNYVMQRMITDEEVRAQILEDYARWKSSQNA